MVRLLHRLLVGNRGRGRKLDIGLGRFWRDVDLVLADLTVALGGHLVAGALIGDHLRKRHGLRRIGWLVLGRGHGRRGLVWLLVRLLVLRRRVGGRTLRLCRPVHRPGFGRGRRRLICRL